MCYTLYPDRRYERIEAPDRPRFGRGNAVTRAGIVGQSANRDLWEALKLVLAET